MTYSWQVVDTISPVFSNAGVNNWDLCLAHNSIIAVPRSFWLTVKAGVWAGLGAPGALRSSWSEQAESAGYRLLEDNDYADWQRYPVEELEAIVLQRRWLTASEIRIKKRGQEEHIYGAFDFNEIVRARPIFRRLYPALYSEKGRWPAK